MATVDHAQHALVPVKFYLGTGNPSWVWREPAMTHPLFVSARRIGRYKTVKPATQDWALDSGGFTELNLFGEWRTTPAEYARQVRRYADEVGRLQWASQQDWMCEPFVLAKTGLTVATHQRLTIENYLHLRDLDADLPWVPVIQGWRPDDYVHHVDAWGAAGVDLNAEPLVGIGSVCRRAHLHEMGNLIVRLHGAGIRLHGFGMKADGVHAYGWALASSDSLAWTMSARRQRGNLCGVPHRGENCNNCPRWATMWADNVGRRSGGRPWQLALDIA